MSSFLGGLLSDIRGGNPEQRLPSQSYTRPQAPQKRPASSPKTQPNDAVNEGTPETDKTLKLKADAANVSEVKLPKTLKRSDGSPNLLAKPPSSVPNRASVQRPGTGRLPQDVVSKLPSQKPQPMTNANVSNEKETAPPPKKGSWREIMQRGKRAHQVNLAQGIGQIKHKETVKLSRQERLKLAHQEKQKTLAPGKAIANTPATTGKPSPVKATAVDRPGSSNAGSAAPFQKKERPPLAYKGTMRSQPQIKAKATAPRTSQASRARVGAYEDQEMADADDPYARRYHYAGSSDDDRDNEDDDDIMGGGFDELEAEEELSLRAARKEDAAALREEAAHRNDKLARKKQLEALKNARAAKRS